MYNVLFLYFVIQKVKNSKYVHLNNCEPYTDIYSFLLFRHNKTKYLPEG